MFSPRLLIATSLLVLFMRSVSSGQIRAVPKDPQRSVRVVQVGSSAIQIAASDYGDSRYLFCNLHDDENTSVEAAASVLNRRSGRLIEITHSGDRNCVFALDGTEYKFDPNRIFTSKGVAATVAKLSQPNKAAEKEVEDFGHALLQFYALEDVEVVVALHNNTDARYSAANYLKGNEYAKDAADVHIEEESDTDDFFFVTERRLFDALKERNQNVVLQNNETVTDDGSLSVYCGQHGKSYVNVEAQHGHLDQQVKMIEVLLEVLDGNRHP